MDTKSRGCFIQTAVCHLQATMDVAVIKLSVRSLGEVDTTAFSSAFNGGGHRNASSCIVAAEEWDCWRCK